MWSVQSLVFLFLASDHYNYSRWVSVHIRDIQPLPADLKDVFCKFWVVQKSYNWFSTILIDQAHEQENAKVKGNGGVVGLTENPAALCRWLLSCPELARLLTQFEEQYLPETNSETECTHHEEGLSHQMRFHNQVNKLVEEINGLGHPFEEQCQELVILNTRECADDSVVAKVCQIEKLGEKQYKQYRKEVLEDRFKPIHATIKKNLLPLFSTTKRKTKATAKKIKAIRHDVGLFGRLYMGNQQREYDPDKFFSHENHTYPLSLSEYGKLRLCTKSDLLKLLTSSNQKLESHRFDCKIVDGAALIHILTPKNVTAFSSYADQVFMSFIKRELLAAKRIDIMWDQYQQDSVKSCTREKRGAGV